MEKLTQSEVIRRFKEVHGDKYDYSKVDYKNKRTKVSIVCKAHGAFIQSPEMHYFGNGCPKCGLLNRQPKSTYKEWKTLVDKNHSGRYKYPKIVEDFSLRVNVNCICRSHGVFSLTAKQHIKLGCRQCTQEARNRSVRDKLKIPTEKFVSRCKERHNSKYEYDIENIKKYHLNALCKIPIIYNAHGEFWQQASSHLNGIGCPACGFKKALKSKTKPYKLSTRTLRLMGYEHIAVDILLKLKVDDTYIRQPKPMSYVYSGKKRKYYCDIKVGKIYIEVKSLYTLVERGWTLNKSKHRNAKESGKTILLWIIQNNKVRKIPETWYKMTKKEFKAWLNTNTEYLSRKELKATFEKYIT